MPAVACTSIIISSNGLCVGGNSVAGGEQGCCPWVSGRIAQRCRCTQLRLSSHASRCLYQYHHKLQRALCRRQQCCRWGAGLLSMGEWQNSPEMPVYSVEVIVSCQPLPVPVSS